MIIIDTLKKKPLRFEDLPIYTWFKFPNSNLVNLKHTEHGFMVFYKNGEINSVLEAKAGSKSAMARVTRLEIKETAKFIEIE